MTSSPDVAMLVEQCRRFADACGDPVFLLDDGGVIVAASAGAHAAWGYAEGALGGLTLTHLLAAPTLARHRDGTLFPVEIRSDLPVQGTYRQTVIRVLGDHDEMVALRDREERYSRIFNGATSCMAFTATTDGRILDVNEAWVRAFGVTRAEAVERTALELGLWANPSERQACLALLEQQGRLSDFELALLTPTGARHFVANAEFVEVRGGRYVVWELRDVTERKQAEERARLARQVLDRLNHRESDETTIRDLLRLVKESTGFEAVGIRLREGDDFPYFETTGFPEQFVQLERSLCAHDQAGAIVRDAQGNPFLECMCGNILSGRTDPTLPFFTAAGSFWTNCTTDLLASTTERERQTRTRNRCNSAGYESVALIPLRVCAATIGLLHFNDHRRNQFTLELIRFFEGLGASIGIALTHQHAAEALRASEHRFRALAENISSAVAVYRAVNDGEDFVFVDFNLAAERMEKIRREELIGKSVLSVFPGVKEFGLFEVLQRVWRTGQPERHPEAFYRDERLEGWRENFVYQLPSGELVAAYEDLTAAKQAEQALRESEKRFQALVETTSDFVWEMDSRGGYTYCSPQLETLWGLRPGEMLGKTPFDLLPPEDREQAIRGFAALAESAIPFSNMELRSFDGAGQIKSLEISGVPFFDSEGRLAGFRGITRDVTERKRLQAGLAQADRLASMGLLAAGVAHEINNPLAYVLYNVDSLAQDLPKLVGAAQRIGAALRSRVDDEAFAKLAGDGAELLEPVMLEDAADRAREALEGVQRIKAITRGLGTFSRVERMECAAVDLNSAIEHAATMAHNEIRIRAQLVKDLGPVPAVWASEGKLAQVFLNLLINAAQAIDEGDVEHHRIGIRTWAEGHAVLAEVTDTGTGIPPENLARVFEPFFTTKTVGAGSGLGLAICRNIVTEFGGDLRVESQVGKGTRFVVRLPVPEEAPAEPPDEAPPATPQPLAVRGRILVVDNEVALRRGLQRLLGHAHEVVTAASGAEGRAILERDVAFDLVLCDLMMPAISGMDLHAWLAQHDPALAARVVFVTGGAFTPRAADYVASVGNLCVEKPFDAAQLTSLVAELVGAAKSKR